MGIESFTPEMMSGTKGLQGLADCAYLQCADLLPPTGGAMEVTVATNVYATCSFLDVLSFLNMLASLDCTDSISAYCPVHCPSGYPCTSGTIATTKLICCTDSISAYCPVHCPSGYPCTSGTVATTKLICCTDSISAYCPVHCPSGYPCTSDTVATTKLICCNKRLPRFYCDSCKQVLLTFLHSSLLYPPSFSFAG